MNRKQTTKKAKDLYGPGAAAVNVSSVDRHQRFGIMYYSTGGALDVPAIGCLGHGDSFDAAWDHALKNPIAQAIAGQWQKTKDDFETFKDDPHGYLEARKQEMNAVLEKGENNG